jgi:hypothetical protein
MPEQTPPVLQIQSKSVGRSRFLAYLALRGSAARICRSYPFVPAMRGVVTPVPIAAKQPTVLVREGLAEVLPLTCPTTESPPICSEIVHHGYSSHNTASFLIV